MSGTRLFGALHRLLVTWDESVSDLGPEWNALAARIEDVRETLPQHEADYAVLMREVARFTGDA